MPVILDNGSDDLFTWLDSKRSEWSPDLQALLQPFKGELECYPVSKDVGKVGNDSVGGLLPDHASFTDPSLSPRSSFQSTAQIISRTSPTSSAIKRKPQKPRSRRRRWTGRSRTLKLWAIKCNTIQTNLARQQMLSQARTTRPYRSPHPQVPNVHCRHRQLQGLLTRKLQSRHHNA